MGCVAVACSTAGTGTVRPVLLRGRRPALDPGLSLDHNGGLSVARSGRCSVPTTNGRSGTRASARDRHHSRVTLRRLWSLLPVALPLLAGLLSPLSTIDLAYQLRLGELIVAQRAIP